MEKKKDRRGTEIDISKAVVSEKTTTREEMKKFLLRKSYIVNPTVLRLITAMDTFPKEDVKEIQCADQDGAKSLYHRILGYIKTHKALLGVSKSDKTVFLYHEEA